MSDAQKYRTKAEVADYKKVDPISQVLEVIKEKKYLTDKQIQDINDDVKSQVAECEKFADESPYPEKQQLYDMVYEEKGYPFINHRL